MTKEPRILSISIGDPNGIGPEIVFKTFADKRMFELCTPVVHTTLEVAQSTHKMLGIKHFPYHILKGKGRPVAGKINIRPTPDQFTQPTPGNPTQESGAHSFNSLKQAAQCVLEEQADALVTAPINKKNIQNQEFQFPGHTEFLQATFGGGEALMLMHNDEMKIAMVTGHTALRNVADSISTERIEQRVEQLARCLTKDFGITRPKIAVLSLNPHAGDQGILGDEETRFMEPCVDRIREDHDVLVFGPFPADGFFSYGSYKSFDGILAMYHDQALIPFKLLSTNGGVNYTANLACVRTSPDHGTAYDIAGKGVADEKAFRRAIYSALEIVEKRK